MTISDKEYERALREHRVDVDGNIYDDCTDVHCSCNIFECIDPSCPICKESSLLLN